MNSLQKCDCNVLHFYSIDSLSRHLFRFIIQKELCTSTFTYLYLTSYINTLVLWKEVLLCNSTHEAQILSLRCFRSMPQRKCENRESSLTLTESLNKRTQISQSTKTPSHMGKWGKQREVFLGLPKKTNFGFKNELICIFSSIFSNQKDENMAFY